jgi:hypothetical protein
MGDVSRGLVFSISSDVYGNSVKEWVWEHLEDAYLFA